MTITLSNDGLQDFIGEAGHSRINNYILPGLSSIMLSGGDSVIRMFENTRNQVGTITPHSHRFDLACCVLRGEVHNSLYLEEVNPPIVGHPIDEYEASTLTYLGEPGHYGKKRGRVGRWRKYPTKYSMGQWYFMKAAEIHSIEFSSNARVLVIEGPDTTNETTILEPYVNGKVVPTFRVEGWMFQKESA